MSLLKKNLAYSTLALSLIAAGTASANGLYFTADGGYGTSAAFNVLQSNVNATSTYTSNIGAVGSFDDLIGSVIGLTDTSTGGSVTGFLDGTTPLNDAVDGSFGADYTLDFSYTLSGTAVLNDGSGLLADGTLDANNDGLIDSGIVIGPGGPTGLDAIVPNYTTGTIVVTYTDVAGAVLGAGNTQQVLQLDLVSATVDGANVILMADVDYSWYAGGSALVENFFNFVDPVNGLTSWYDIWLSSTPVDPLVISTRSDFNVDPNAVPVDTCGGADCTTFERQTNINNTTTVTVPEPASIALLGLGLAGIGAGLRRRKRA